MKIERYPYPNASPLSAEILNLILFSIHLNPGQYSGIILIRFLFS